MFSRRHLTTCRVCGVEVWLARTVHGRWQPVDIPQQGQREDPAGSVSVWQDVHGVLQVRALPPGAAAPYWQRRLMPHAATCGKSPAELGGGGAADAAPGPRPAGDAPNSDQGGVVVPFPERRARRRRPGGTARHATRARRPAIS